MTTHDLTRLADDLTEELCRVAPPNSIVSIPRPEDGDEYQGCLLVGWADDAGGGGYAGLWRDGEAVLTTLKALPDWDGETTDWSQLGIPEFDD